MAGLQRWDGRLGSAVKIMNTQHIMTAGSMLQAWSRSVEMSDFNEVLTSRGELQKRTCEFSKARIIHLILYECKWKNAK